MVHPVWWNDIGSTRNKFYPTFKLMSSGGVWSLSSDLNTAITMHGSCGTAQNIALSFGGNDPTAETEAYNGSSWTTDGIGDLNTIIYRNSGCGSRYAGLSFGGLNPPVYATTETEEFDGSSWATDGVGNLNSGVQSHASAGTQSAGLSFGGLDSSGTVTEKEVEEYNGSSWTTSGVGDLNTAVWMHGGAGIQSSALSFGGGYGVDSTTDTTEEYNGTSWSVGVDMNSNHVYHAGCGTSEWHILSWGGLTDASNPGSFTKSTENYNGNVWRIDSDLPINWSEAGSAGTRYSALSFGGYNGSLIKTTCEYGKNLPDI